MFKKFILFFGFILCAIAATAQDFPERSNTLVTDYTNTLSPADKQQLERKLVTFNDSTSTQIAVVILKSVGNYDINDYGAQLLRKWGIGQKDKNNGVLVLVAIGDRKMSIQTGYGAEGPLPDIVTQDIIQNDLKPHFKQGDYYGGLDAGTNSIIKAMKGEYKAAKKANKHNSGAGSAGLIVLMIIVVILILIFRNRGGGGGRQIIGRRGGASPFWWFLAGNMLGGGGRSSGSDWGGFSGGDSDSGGGFGGFGGGSGGGGGSSGSW
ncbi:TPM domain-containing protein [Mucilaginibacter angelicae]|uniref:TPM domain-containing protein n=1 Tax=Mucilaginibacter angelicae TaxID=869718 RepID=A0ABV6L7I2_9SPHI